MKIFILSSMIFFALILTNCCASKNSAGVENKKNGLVKISPNTIQQNLSIVQAEVINLEKKNSNDFKLLVKILSVKENDVYPSIAVTGNEYMLTPNFIFNGESVVDNDINKSLLKLSELSLGDKFKAEIFLDNRNGWLIQKVLE